MNKIIKLYFGNDIGKIIIHFISHPLADMIINISRLRYFNKYTNKEIICITPKKHFFHYTCKSGSFFISKKTIQENNNNIIILI